MKDRYGGAAGFVLELGKWAGRMSLLSRGDAGKIVSRHFLDSMIIEGMIPGGSRVLDIGGGNGFPAIPLALFREDLQICSFESRTKRAVFLNNIKNKLKLINYKIINDRIEQNIETLKKAFTVVISRAYEDMKEIIRVSDYYCADSVIYLIYNKISEKSLKNIGEEYQQLINTVDKFVYYLQDGIERHAIRVGVNKN